MSLRAPCEPRNPPVSRNSLWIFREFNTDRGNLEWMTRRVNDKRLSPIVMTISLMTVHETTRYKLFHRRGWALLTVSTVSMRACGGIALVATIPMTVLNSGFNKIIVHSNRSWPWFKRHRLDDDSQLFRKRASDRVPYHDHHLLIRCSWGRFST